MTGLVCAPQVRDEIVAAKARKATAIEEDRLEDAIEARNLIRSLEASLSAPPPPTVDRPRVRTVIAAIQGVPVSMAPALVRRVTL